MITCVDMCSRLEEERREYLLNTYNGFGDYAKQLTDYVSFEVDADKIL